MAEYQAALINTNGVVVDVVILNDASTWEPAPGLEVVAIPKGSSVGIGWTYDGEDWSAPPSATTSIAAETVAATDMVMALSATNGVCTGDVSQARTFTLTPTGPATLRFIGLPPSGQQTRVLTVITYTNKVYPITYPAQTQWVDSEPPQAKVGDRLAVTLFTHGDQTGWLATVSL